MPRGQRDSRDLELARAPVLEPGRRLEPEGPQLVGDESPVLDPAVHRQLPLKRASRFSPNAATPSRKSADCAISAWAFASRSS
jgi:hypothetical protein